MSPAQLLHYQLGWATSYGMASRVQLLVSHGVDVNAPFDDGTTATERAARHGNPDIVDLLVRAGATAPSLAPADVDLVRLLLSLGADPNIRDGAFNSTPLGWAEFGFADDAAAVLAPLTVPNDQTGGP
jgi:ankyrin repeat protein